MDESIINWLLEGPSWLRFAVEKHLLGGNPDSRIAANDDVIVGLRKRLKDSHLGLSALKAGKISAEATGNAYWDLFFLADIGFTAGDLGLGEELDGILDRQLPDGTYSLEPGMAPDYYCLSAIPVATIAEMGCRNDLRVKRFVQTIWNKRCPDGGWHCEGRERTGCPMANLNALMLLGQYEQYRNSSEVEGAIAMLLEHWERREEGWQKDGFGVGRRFRSLEYPAIKYGILRVLDVLSLFPSATGHPAYQNMLDFVRSKSIDGKYFAEAINNSYAGLDFAQKQVPSRWITFLISRFEKRSSRC